MFSSSRFNRRIHRVKDNFKQSVSVMIDDLFSAIHEEIEFYELENRGQGRHSQRPHFGPYQRPPNSLFGHMLPKFELTPELPRLQSISSHDCVPFFIDTKGDPTILELMEESKEKPLIDEKIEADSMEAMIAAEEEMENILEEGEIDDDDATTNLSMATSYSNVSSQSKEFPPIQYRAIRVDNREIKCVVEGCPQSFISREGFSIHFADVHPGVGPLPCTKCETMLTDPDHMFQHHFSMHQEGIFECAAPNCNYSNYLRCLVLEHYQKVHSKSPIEGWNDSKKFVSSSPVAYVSSYYDDFPDCGMMNGLFRTCSTPAMDHHSNRFLSTRS